MAIIENNVIYNEYLGGYKTGNESSVLGNAINGSLLSSNLVIPKTVNGKIVIRIGDNSFHASAVSSIELPDSLLEIGQCAFDTYSLRLEELILPKSLTKIGIYAFSTNSIKSFTIFENVESIGFGAFSHNLALRSINVDEKNPYFVSLNGVLYSKNMKTLYCVPYLAKNYKIPFTVTTLMNRAISQERAKTIWIPASISIIGSNVLFLLRNLRTIHILGNIEKISSGFISSDNKNFRSIVYHGAKAYNDTNSFKGLNEIEIYVCKEYPDEYFAGKKVNRIGSCYTICKTCKKQRSVLSTAFSYSILILSV